MNYVNNLTWSLIKCPGKVSDLILISLLAPRIFLVDVVTVIIKNNPSHTADIIRCCALQAGQS